MYIVSCAEGGGEPWRDGAGERWIACACEGIETEGYYRCVDGTAEDVKVTVFFVLRAVIARLVGWTATKGTARLLVFSHGSEPQTLARQHCANVFAH